MRLVGRCFLFVAAVVATAGACIILASGRDARAQIAKTVRIVVPYAPGGAADIVARLVAEQVGRSRGPAIVVENRPGAGGAVGTETVARAVPDGNTAARRLDAVPHRSAVASAELRSDQELYADL